MMWLESKDGDFLGYTLYRRHYSSKKNPRPKVRLFVGPGEKLVLIGFMIPAVFAWRKFIDDSGQRGVNCAVFRNESSVRSSDLIREAMALAWRRWPGERLYTTVNPAEIRGTNPGYCFLMAGWRKCGVTKKGLVVLEVFPKGERTMSVINWTELNPPERKRTYHFPDGECVSFENVTRIEVRESGKHRIETADGRKAFVCPGWLWMELDMDAWTC